MSHLLARSGPLLSCFASSTNEPDDGDDGQGFLKVHGSLTALITHHSIMPELLPVTLNIHRHNPSFSHSDPDYASLQVSQHTIFQPAGGKIHPEFSQIKYTFWMRHRIYFASKIPLSIVVGGVKIY